jgi:hypothetical protein
MPAGFDFSVYKYNAELTLNGVDVFSQERDKWQAKEIYTSKNYLDYSPIQFQVFKAASFLSLKYKGYSDFGYRILTFLLETIGVLVLIRFHEKDINWYNIVAYKAILLLLAPLFILYNYQVFYNDKIFFLVKYNDGDRMSKSICSYLQSKII